MPYKSNIKELPARLLINEHGEVYEFVKCVSLANGKCLDTIRKPDGDDLTLPREKMLKKIRNLKKVEI